MAITKLDDMPQIPVEHRAVPQKLVPHAPPKDHSEIFGQRNPVSVPVTDAGLSSELNLLRDLRDTQNDLHQNSKFFGNLDGTKNIVIYYSQANIKMNTDNVNIMAPSPVNATKYDRIDNMILLTQNELQDNFILEEGHIDNTLTFDGIMYPGTTPKSNDLFYLNDVNGKGVLYIVTTVQPIAMLDFTGWKVEFQKHHQQLKPEEMTHLIQDHFVFKFENLGTDRVPVLQQKVAVMFDKITELYNMISDEFLHRFFDKSRNIIRLKYIPDTKEPSEFMVLGKEHEFSHGDCNASLAKEIFDPFVMEFIAQTFVQEKIQYKGYSIYPVNPVWIGEEFHSMYRNSIYNAFSHQRPDLIKYFYHYPVPFNVNTIRDLAYENWHYFELLSNQSSKCLDIFPLGFVGRVKSNTLYNKEYDDEKLLKYNLLIKFANIKNYTPTEEDIKPFMKDIDLVDDLELYGVAPLLMYICYNFRNTVGQRIR